MVPHCGFNLNFPKLLSVFLCPYWHLYTSLEKNLLKSFCVGLSAEWLLHIKVSDSSSVTQLLVLNRSIACWWLLLTALWKNRSLRQNNRPGEVLENPDLKQREEVSRHMHGIKRMRSHWWWSIWEPVVKSRTRKRLTDQLLFREDWALGRLPDSCNTLWETGKKQVAGEMEQNRLIPSFYFTNLSFWHFGPFLGLESRMKPAYVTAISWLGSKFLNTQQTQAS